VLIRIENLKLISTNGRTNTQTLITLAETLTAHEGGCEATISNKVSTNARLFQRLRAKKGCTVSTFGKAMNWFSANWPADLEWPGDNRAGRGRVRHCLSSRRALRTPLSPRVRLVLDILGGIFGVACLFFLLFAGLF